MALVASSYGCTFGGGGSALDGLPTDGQAMRFVFEQMPRLLDVYERRVRLAQEESGLEPEFSPTLAAVEGLTLVYRDDIAGARRLADQLAQHMAYPTPDAALVEFPWSYQTVWPYDLEAPWPSALAQGYALALFDAIADADGSSESSATAAALARAYLLGIDQGGFTRRDETGVFFEEYPLDVPTRVLNGAMIATIALSDHLERHDDAELADLLDQAASRWASHIGDYSIADEFQAIGAGENLVGSAYSLAPQRAELLFRLVGTGSVEVDSVQLTVGDAVTRLDVGSPGDDDRSSTGFVWFNPAFQNWQASSSVGTATFRAVKPASGEYDHAPFSFAVPTDVDVSSGSELEIVHRGMTGGSVDAQIFVGDQYALVGSLSPSADWQTDTFPVDPAWLAPSGAGNRTPPFEAGYFADNYLIGRALAGAIGEETVAETVETWESSMQLVPGVFDPRPLPSLEGIDAGPVMALLDNDQESLHVEYPAVERGPDGSFQMLYAATGPESGWTVLSATADDIGGPWKRHGAVAAFGDYGNAAFPDIEYLDDGSVLVTATVDEDGDGAYDAVIAATGADLATLQPSGTVADEGGLDGSLWRDDDGFHVTYTISAPPGVDLKIVDSVDGSVWGAPRVLLHFDDQASASMYTQDSFIAQGARWWLIDASRSAGGANPRRFAWYVYCRDRRSGLMVRQGELELNVTDPGLAIWNQHRYGVEVVEVVGERRLIVMYNGIRLDEGDGNGQIGRGELVLPDLDADGCVAA